MEHDERYEMALQDQVTNKGIELSDQDQHIAKLEKALRLILSIGERHTDSAVGRRIADFRLAIDVARMALYSV